MTIFSPKKWLALRALRELWWGTGRESCFSHLSSFFALFSYLLRPFYAFSVNARCGCLRFGATFCPYSSPLCVFDLISVSPSLTHTKTASTLLNTSRCLCWVCRLLNAENCSLYFARGWHNLTDYQTPYNKYQNSFVFCSTCIFYYIVVCKYKLVCMYICMCVYLDT